MTIKQSAAFLSLMAALTFAGAGCLSAPVSEPRASAPETGVADEPSPSVPAAEAPSDDCGTGLVRFETQTSDIPFTFCHETASSATEDSPVSVTERDGVVTLATEANPDLRHTVRAVRIEPTDDIAAAIADQFMTDENRAFCDVVTYEGPKETEYVIAGGDLETQEKCGAYRDGFFLSSTADPYVLFYVTVGQDTFMDSDQWLRTLRPSVK